MAGTTAFVFVLLGGAVVAVTAVIARAKVEIARIQATHAPPPPRPNTR